MKKFIHISERYNRNSILKNGLLPSKVLLSHHLEDFRNKEYLSDNEDRILYTWESSEKDNKFIKDMIYCKIWITPRNKKSIKYENEYGIDFNFKNKSSIFSWAPYLNMIYDVYKLQSLDVLNEGDGKFHVQESDDSYYSTTYEMNNKYAHDDKILYFSKSKETNFKIIKQAYLNINKNGKINIKII